jgi:hypothetical protein
MTEEISLQNPVDPKMPEEEKNFLVTLEEKVGHLLIKYQELVKERDTLSTALNAEREARIRLEKKMELLSMDRDKVRGRIDQLLHRLKSIDV